MNYYKYLLIVSFVIFAGIIGYTQGNQAGRASANAEHAQALLEHQEAINRQADLLNNALNKEVIDYSTELRRLRGDYLEIHKTLKNAPQPLVIFKDGECVPSSTYLEAREVLLRGETK